MKWTEYMAAQPKHVLTDVLEAINRTEDSGHLEGPASECFPYIRRIVELLYRFTSGVVSIEVGDCTITFDFYEQNKLASLSIYRDDDNEAGGGVVVVIVGTDNGGVDRLYVTPAELFIRSIESLITVRGDNL